MARIKEIAAAAERLGVDFARVNAIPVTLQALGMEALFGEDEARLYVRRVQ